MRKYKELVNNPPEISVPKVCREVIFGVVFEIGDITNLIRFKKNVEGDFVISGGGLLFKNYRGNYERFELEWAADEGEWDYVMRLINSGPMQIDYVRFR